MNFYRLSRMLNLLLQWFNIQEGKRRESDWFKEWVLILDTKCTALFALSRLAKCICQMAFPTILSVEVICHKNTCTTGFIRAFSSQASDFAIFINFVEFQDSELDLLSLVLDFLGCSVILLLSLLSTTSQSQYKMKGWLFLDIVITKSTPIFKLLASKNQALLIWRDSCCGKLT